MAKKRITKQLDDFVANNAELIAEYDSTEGTYPFDFCKYDVVEKIGAMMKASRGIDFRTTLSTALYNAIRYQEPVMDSLSALFTSTLKDGGGTNTTQLYFDEIGELYKKHKGDTDLDYKPENREKLIELNTKMVISVAKRYQGMGLTLQELICAGNEGLCVAWDKYDPAKAQLKENVLSAVADLPDEFDYNSLEAHVQSFFTYGSLKKKFEDKFKPGHKYTKKELLGWIDHNIFNAKFSSVCMMWIKAYILIEIDNNSRVVKKPKSEIYKDKEKCGSYQRESLLNLDQPIAGDTETTFADTLSMEDESNSELDVTESYDEYKSALNKLLEGVCARDRQVCLYKFGIGVPRALLPKEIADKLGLSVARVSQICQLVLNKMRANAQKYDMDPAYLFEAVSKFR